MKVNIRVNGEEQESVVGLNAGFGSFLPQKAKHAQRLPASFTKPLNSCSLLSPKLSGSIALSLRGDCEFKTKALIAQEGGAAALVVINTDEGLLEMGCGNDTNVDIGIPVVTISNSGGDEINKSMAEGKKGKLSFSFWMELLLYSPTRPIVDYSVVFLWLMAVGTVVCASLWSDFIEPEQRDGYQNDLTPKGSSSAVNKEKEDEILSINTKSAVVFVITASTFLLLLYFFMSSSFVWVLIILFCIGGIEGMHSCLVPLLSRKCEGLGEKKLNLPLLGEVSILSMSVLIFCVIFAVLWAITRKESYSWIGQDVLGIYSLNMPFDMSPQVATVLLCCAFVYDIFWVFLSPLIFRDSVMIAVARGDKSGGESIPMLLRVPRLADPYYGYNMIGFG
ncbi:hypothetical protein M569_12504, partial [Genlisea aurea]